MTKKHAVKLLTALIIILAILIGILIFTLINQRNITGEAISTYTHTRAICDENNLCQDYEITCQGKKMTNINPTGFIVQNPENWKDPRNPDIIEQWCNVSE